MVTIASPCHEDWNGMTPRTSGRHCAACDQVVVDLTDLGTAERRERLKTIAATVATGGRVCVRGRIERDGALAGSRRVLTAGVAVILAMTIAGCQGDGPAVEPRQDPTTQQPTRGVEQGDVAEPPRVLMGEMEAPVRGQVVEPTPVMGAMCAPETMQGKVVAPQADPAPTPDGDG